MRTVWLVAFVALGASGPGLGARQAAADAAAGFPSYSREDEVNACLFGYGMENSSVLDCLARDETYRATLSKKWADIDDRFRKNCLMRLGNRHLNSYFYLDRCIRSSEKDTTIPE